MANTEQVVFVHGFLGWGEDDVLGIPYWGEAKNVDPSNNDSNYKEAIYASVGPLSSYHDRACELFYQLVGGDCDYGEEHSEKFKHQQILSDWAKGKPGKYPVWNEDNPIHFVTHSQGSPTVRMLQHLLDKNFFNKSKTNPINTSANWIKSITSISGANNGTTALYAVGCDETTGMVKYPSFILFLSGLLAPFLNNLKPIYNFGLNQWGLQHSQGESPLQFLDKIFQHNAFISSKDNAFYDLTVHGACEWNDVLIEHDETYYFSYTTSQTFKIPFTDNHIFKLSMNPLLLELTRKIGNFNFSEDFKESLNGVNFTDSEWHENDGVVPLFSQEFPRIPNVHPHIFLNNSATNFETGVWNVMDHELKDWDHLDIMMFPDPKRKEQKEFFRQLYQRLYSL